MIMSSANFIRLIIAFWLNVLPEEFRGLYVVQGFLRPQAPPDPYLFQTLTLAASTLTPSFKLATGLASRHFFATICALPLARFSSEVPLAGRAGQGMGKRREREEGPTSLFFSSPFLEGQLVKISPDLDIHTPYDKRARE